MWFLSNPKISTFTEPKYNLVDIKFKVFKPDYQKKFKKKIQMNKLTYQYYVGKGFILKAL